MGAHENDSPASRQRANSGQ